MTADARRTLGYRALMTEVRMTYGDHDPWGTTMGWLFALAEVAYVDTGEVLPDFRPSPLLHSRADIDTDSYEHATVIELIDENRATYADLTSAFHILSRYDDWLRRAGLNY